jgi:group II intron reverse transcriptase/maturase
MGKAVTEVRSPQRKLMPDKAGLGEHEQTSLRGIAQTAAANKQHRFRNLYGMLTLSALTLAWRSLNKNAASGVDKVTAEQYEEDLAENLENLLIRLKGKSYKAKLVKRKYIPKENGKFRPLGIPALEDKIVQKAVATILEAIYEQDFLDMSFGYRPNRSPRMAVDELNFQLQYRGFGYVVEADIKGFFDNMSHDLILELLSKRIDDKAFLNLIRKWLKAGILEPDGGVKYPDTGSPQGSIVSPILSNVYLHYALDKWFDEVVKPRCSGNVAMFRFADDWLCCFQYGVDARQFYRVLPKRLGRYNLEVEPSKTRILRFSRFHPGMKRRFTFLGFEFYWMNDREGLPRVMKRTSRKKLQGGVQRIKDWIRCSRHLPKKVFFSKLKAKLNGHYNYYYTRGNSRSVWRFYDAALVQCYKWLNRRSQRKSLTWSQFKKLWEQMGVPKPRVSRSYRTSLTW